MTLKNLSMVVILALSVATASTAQDNSACKASVVSPQKGDTVGISGDISGTATVPAGMFLWVFVHRQGLGAWWPQSGSAAGVSQGKWMVNATYGDGKDAGANFVVKAVVVDQKGNTDLMNYVASSEKAGTYPGTKIPVPSKDGCSSSEVIIKREN
jgi:hypothetical protein